MMRALAKLEQRLRDRDADDNGFTMIEIVVTMTIMLIVLVLFTSGITQAYSAENRVDAAANSQGQLTIAFQRLDKEVRYAVGISNTGTVAGDQYVEFLTSFTGTPVCTEVRVHVATQQLQQRTWTQGMSPLVPSAWTQLASNVTSTAPFTVTQAGSTLNFQRLRILLTVRTGSNATAATKNSDITFTALNTSLTTSSNTICTEGRAVA
jgi:prepilin-type N-terminal cleavage/methylation domain-containing protein